ERSVVPRNGPPQRSRVNGRTGAAIAALLFRVAHGRHPPCDTVDRGALVCWEDFKLIPAINDHEEGLARPAWRSNLGLVVAGAIGVHRIGTLCRGLALATI